MCNLHLQGVVAKYSPACSNAPAGSKGRNWFYAPAGCLKHAWEHACLAVEGLQLARMQITLLLACWLLFLALEVN